LNELNARDHGIKRKPPKPISYLGPLAADPSLTPILPYRSGGVVDGYRCQISTPDLGHVFLKLVVPFENFVATSNYGQEPLSVL
jgi:hypothetical protein